MNKFPLSLVIITLNEQNNIKRCIESVSFADDVLILDSGSTDQTKEIAIQLGARVIHQDWLGFGKQKQKAVELAKNDWVLSLDADEALSPEASQEIKELFQTSALNEDTVYSFPRLTFHLGRPLLHGGNYPDRQRRLFNRKHTRWSDEDVHEKLICKKSIKLNGRILHWSFRDIEHQIQTINKYSSLRAQMWLKQGKSASLFRIIYKPISKFIESYFFKLGFLDGYVGFEVAVVSSVSYFLRLTKLRELKRAQK